MGTYYSKDSQIIATACVQNKSLTRLPSSEQFKTKKHNAQEITLPEPPQRQDEAAAEKKWFMPKDIDIHVTNEISDLFSSFSSGDGPDF